MEDKINKDNAEKEKRISESSDQNKGVDDDLYDVMEGVLNQRKIGMGK